MCDYGPIEFPQAFPQTFPRSLVCCLGISPHSRSTFGTDHNCTSTKFDFGPFFGPFSSPSALLWALFNAVELAPRLALKTRQRRADLE